MASKEALNNLYDNLDCQFCEHILDCKSDNSKTSKCQEWRDTIKKDLDKLEKLEKENKKLKKFKKIIKDMEYFLDICVGDFNLITLREFLTILIDDYRDTERIKEWLKENDK